MPDNVKPRNWWQRRKDARRFEKGRLTLLNAHHGLASQWIGDYWLGKKWAQARKDAMQILQQAYCQLHEERTNE